jgi:hypothetical protein
MDANGALNAVFAAGVPTLSTRSRLRITMLNPTSAPPQLNTSRTDENGIWTSVYDPATRTLRVSVV